MAGLLGAGRGGYKTCWLLFGTSNQLRAGLTLLGITVWLKRQGKRAWFTIAPLVFVLASLIGLIFTTVALLSKPYRTLSKAYADAPAQGAAI